MENFWYNYNNLRSTNDLQIVLLDGQVPQPWKLCDNRGRNDVYMFLVHTCQGAYNNNSPTRSEIWKITMYKEVKEHSSRSRCLELLNPSEDEKGNAKKLTHLEQSLGSLQQGRNMGTPHPLVIWDLIGMALPTFDCLHQGLERSELIDLHYIVP
jgi:hypothetical protein